MKTYPLRVCDVLIPEGLKRAYEVNFRHGSSVYSLKIETEQTEVMSQKVVLGYKCGGRGSNFIVVPIIVPYCAGNDVGFRDLIAHEFGEKQFRNLGHSHINPKHAFLHLGHGILVAGNGIWHSLTHKGTSYFWQRTRPDAPIAGSGNSRLDVMYYYRDDPKPWNFARRRFLAEPDAQVFMIYYYYDISVLESQ